MIDFVEELCFLFLILAGESLLFLEEFLFSPLWRARISANNGTIDKEAKAVTFEDDDDLEQFYEKYGLDPDEQRLDVQQISTGLISREATWSKFYSKNGIVKERVLGKVSY